MSISHTEDTLITCPQCTTRFAANVWLILDAQEHPEQVQALRDAHLNRVVCPSCGHQFTAPLPLLFHDRLQRQVFFAIPPATEEHVWREQARDLSALLIGSIDPDERGPYLNNIRIAQDLADIARAQAKTARLQAARVQIAQVAQQTPPVVREPAQPVPAPPEQQGEADNAQLTAALEALMELAALDELPTLLPAHPILLSPLMDRALNDLADVATEQREYQVAEQLHQVRMRLSRLQADPEQSTPIVAEPVSTVEPVSPHPPQPESPAQLPQQVYQALLETTTPAEMEQLARHYPLLLEPWVDSEIAQMIDMVLEEGDESLAYALEVRRELLTTLRQTRGAAPAVPDQDDETIYRTLPGTAPETEAAIEALFAAADDEDAFAAALIEHPVLLTDEAQQALWQLSSEARQQGDDELAQYAIECRAMLRKIREQLS